jgi:hypothetical protein
MTSDCAAIQQFYAGLMGWNLTVMGPEAGNYVLADVRGHKVCGLNQMPADTAHPSVWMTYLATEDADATAGAITAAGGKLLQEPFEVMDLGRMAVAQDPLGATFAIWQARGSIGSEIANEPGAVVWNEMMSRDLEAAKAFYATVFGYTYTAMGEDGGYFMLVVDGRPVGGIGALPAEVPAEVPAHWGLYFSVDDADKAAAHAAELGGTVSSPPADMPYGREVRLVDGQGAPFSVLTQADQGAG